MIQREIERGKGSLLLKAAYCCILFVCISCTSHSPNKKVEGELQGTLKNFGTAVLTTYSSISVFDFSTNRLRVGWKTGFPINLTSQVMVGEYLVLAKSSYEIVDASGALERHSGKILILDYRNGDLVASIKMGDGELDNLTPIDNDRCAVVLTNEGISRVLVINLTKKKTEWTSESPLNANARVSVASNSTLMSMMGNKLLAISNDTGKTLWSVEVADQLIPPSAHPKGYVYTVSNGGTLQCIDSRTGSELWTSAINIIAPPIVFKDRLICFDGRQVIIVNAISGKEDIQFDLPMTLSSFACIPNGEFLLSGSLGTQLLDSSGSIKWTIEEKFEGFTTSFNYVIGYTIASYSLIEIHSGKVIVSKDFGSEHYPPIVTPDGSIVTGTIEGSVIQLR